MDKDLRQSIVLTVRATLAALGIVPAKKKSKPEVPKRRQGRVLNLGDSSPQSEAPLPHGVYPAGTEPPPLGPLPIRIEWDRYRY